ncbi:hypothetical protein SISSUDRAFT_1052668 [Sistotremastrum suecicum HHB10207 ss-3]|uniref:Uncharacterized protein n=1 Tax=Sistotremastrum suecicum HHB10207 ss-3 TaxID=1314776 RepID=A0A165ZQ60_9AGAM|nr:hypothetical protein SISSUDRAFT_1052668 [Sistotremastrum suecicum HHB10207 ss-3]
MLFIPPPSSHVEGADCPKAQGSNLGPSISQIDSDPAEDLVGYTVGARGPSPPHQTTFSAPQSPGVNVDVSSPAEGELSASPTTPTPSTRPIRPLPSTSRRAIKTSESSPLIDLGSPAVTTSSSAIDGTVTEMNARGAVDPFDNDLKMDGGGQDLDDAPQTSAGSPSRSPIAGAFKRLFNGSPSSSLPSFFKRSRQVSPGASTNAILSASTSSSYGFGQVVISPSQTQSTSHDFRTPVSNVSDYMPPDSMYHTSSHVPEAEDMDVTPPRPLADQNPSSSDSPYHETPTKQTDSRRIPLGTATPRRSSSPDPAPAQGLPSEAETNLNVPANPGPFNKLKHLKAALGARFPPRKGSGGSGGASGSGRVASEQTLNTRSEVDQEAEAASDGQATTLLGVSRPKTRSVSLGSLLGKLGPGKRDDK